MGLTHSLIYKYLLSACSVHFTSHGSRERTVNKANKNVFLCGLHDTEEKVNKHKYRIV